MSLYSAFVVAGREGIYAGSLDSGETTFVVPATTKAEYSDTGHLLMVRDGVLIAYPYDADAMQITGDAVTLATGVSAASPRRR